MRWKWFLFTIWFSLLSVAFVAAQDEGGKKFDRQNWEKAKKGLEYEQEGEEKQFSRKRWKETTENLDYTEERKEPKEKKPETMPETPGFNFSIPAGLARTILIVLVIAVLVVLLLRIFSGGLLLGNQKIKDKYSVYENLEERIHETDLERLLRQALEEKNYRLAIRVYYLMIIKELSNKEWINWKKDKTNYEYLLEMRSRPVFGVFNEVTNIFERVWYGDVELSEQFYRQLSPRFDELLNNIRNAQQR